MRYDFGKELVNYDGETIMRPKNTKAAPKPGERPEEVPATLGWAATQALVALYEDERSLSGDEKFSRFTLAQRIAKGGVVEVSIDEVKTIKDMMAKHWSTPIVGASWPIFDDPLPAAAKDTNGDQAGGGTPDANS